MFITLFLTLSLSLSSQPAASACHISQRLDGTFVRLCEGRRVAVWDTLGNSRVFRPDGTIEVRESGVLVDVLPGR